MKKIYFLLFLLASNYTLVKAQNGNCALPECGVTFFDNVIDNEQNNEPSINKVNVYPNPSRGQINLKLNKSSATNAFITIKRMDGQSVAKQSIQLIDHPHSIGFDLSNRPKGWYIVTIKSDEGIQSSKVLITN